MTERFSHAEMAVELAKLAWSKETWLDECSSGKGKRADWELEIRRREHAVLEQAAADYRRAAERTADVGPSVMHINDNIRNQGGQE